MGQAYICRRGGGKKQLRTEIILWDQDWVVPKGVTSVAVRLFGGGGAGQASNGSGGGSGHMAYGVVSVTPTEIIPITIGLGAPSGAGGTTSFGAHLSATGGAAPTSLRGGSGGSGGGGANSGGTNGQGGGHGSYGGGGGAGNSGTADHDGNKGGNGGTYGGGGGGSRVGT